MKQRIRILFNTWANADNVNSQSLTAREIARRLDPARFCSTFYVGSGQQADARLSEQGHIRLVRIPPRLGSLRIASEMLWGPQDILFYPDVNERASRIYWMLKGISKRKRVLLNVETSLAQSRAGGGKAYGEFVQMLARSDQVFAITPAIAESLWNVLHVRAEVIPLGVDLELFQPADRSLRHGTVRVLYVATLQPRKQPHLILEFARALKFEPVEFHLIGPVIGDPGYAEQLYGDKERDGLENVFFHGAQMPEQVNEWMQASDIFVLPSRLEGFGKVMIEAGATGLPCIIFSDYQSTTVVDGITGYQVTTEREMLEALRQLIRDRPLRQRLGAAAVKHARGFDWNGIVRKWEQVFGLGV